MSSPLIFNIIMLVVKRLLIIMFTQRNSCIGRLQVEKHVSLFAQE